MSIKKLEILIEEFEFMQQSFREIGANDSEVSECWKELLKATLEGESYTVRPQDWGLYTCVEFSDFVSRLLTDHSKRTVKYIEMLLKTKRSKVEKFIDKYCD